MALGWQFLTVALGACACLCGLVLLYTCCGPIRTNDDPAQPPPPQPTLTKSLVSIGLGLVCVSLGSVFIALGWR